MDNWKLRIQYIDKYSVLMDKTEKQAKKIFNDLKQKMYEKKIVWCELIYSPCDADEIIVDDFENKVACILGNKVIL